MKKFLSPEAEVLELNLADVICTSPIAPIEPDPNAATGEAPAPGEGSVADGSNMFDD